LEEPTPIITKKRKGKSSKGSTSKRQARAQSEDIITAFDSEVEREAEELMQQDLSGSELEVGEQEEDIQSQSDNEKGRLPLTETSHNIRQDASEHSHTSIVSRTRPGGSRGKGKGREGQ
jgi:hypothetical protein